MTKESEKVVEKFVAEMEQKEDDELLMHDYFIIGIDYNDEENLDEGLHDAMEAFLRRYHYDYEKWIDTLLNCLLARDAYYKMMHRVNLLQDNLEHC